MNDAPTETASDDSTVEATKSDLIRDAVVFQIKLIVDGIRDFVLIPVSLIASILSLVRPGDKPGSEFYEVVAFGRRTEKMINLFGAADRLGRDVDDSGPDLDSLVSDVENYVRKEAQSERFEAARDRIERALGLRTGKRATSADDAADAPDGEQRSDG